MMFNKSLFSAIPHALLAMVSTQQTSDNLESKVKDIVSDQVKHHRELVSRGRHARELQASQQCLDDSESLLDDNPGLQNAYNAFEDDYDSALDACGLVCTVNEDTFPASAPFRVACDAAGGTIFEYDFKYSCVASANGQTERLLWEVLNADACVAGAVCNAIDVGKTVEDEVNGLFDLFETLFASEGINLNCGAEFTVSDDAGTVLLRSEIGGGITSGAFTIGSGLSVAAALASLVLV